MKAKIIKCSDSLMWYRDKVGEVIEIERETPMYYWAREPSGYINIVHKSDVELLERNEND